MLPVCCMCDSTCVNIADVRVIVFLFHYVPYVQKVYEELLHYREEYREAAEKLCSCRHMSRLPDVSSLQQGF